MSNCEKPKGWRIRHHEIYVEYDKLIFKKANVYFKDPEIAREITNDVWVEYAEALKKTRRNV